MKVHVDPDDVYKKTTDGRGRFYLGPDFADTEIEIAVLEVVEDEE